ncbi:hypothetical protein [Acidovorax sp. BLS4]|uniref:hypothetical protein n=1 Tax=Acidovorax sp. BLS4 TaxID=3273430 RepID=UPI00294335DD|nr:hypothetical protein [Paracidovorax avenae]WOI43799.1 hypothetical protein R1Z03_14765 [Paracidovorax avenae]
MTGKHHAWFKSWSRDPDGHLLHSSGLRVLVLQEDGYTDLETDDASMAIFQAREASRGVPVHDLAARVQRLLGEAAEWHQRNPS